ncbi:MAG: dUTP diphosphatase [Flexilinea sp.]|jgi:dUTP pyrophosphatase
MTIEKLKFAKISDEAIIPTRKNPQDAGLDLYSTEQKTFQALDYGIIRTGIFVNIPEGYVGLVLPKSRNNFLLGGGVVDAGYQGEILVKIFNVTSERLEISIGQAVAQMLIIPIEIPEAAEVSIGDLYQEESKRGRNGGIAEQKGL